jgi:quercetin dioxygenase-like cupin family protein
MGTVEIFHDWSGGWNTGTSAQSAGFRAHAEGNPIKGGERRHRHEGSETAPQLTENRVGPNASVQSHAHAEGEILYVLSGSLELGSRQLVPGSSIYIPAMTLYSFTAGPDGLCFLNFRGRRDDTHYSKQQFMAMRDAKPSTRPALSGA